MTEKFSDGFQTTLTTAITSGVRPVTFSVAATSADLAGGTFSIVIYDVGTEASPTHAEVLEVADGSTTSWTATNEPGHAATTHAIGSTVRLILTRRSLTQQMVDHTDTTATPDPHPPYIRKTLLTTIGDLMVGVSTGLARLAKGADGTVLTADSTVPAGLSWKALGASALTTLGDLLTVASTGAVRLPIGAVNQILAVQQNAALLANPTSAPTLAAGTPTTNTWAVSTSYLIGYSFSNVYGETLVSSSTATYASGVTPVAQNVTCPAAPAGTTFLNIYVGLTLSTMHKTNAIATPSTSASTTVLVTGPNLAGASPPTANLTGGRSPAWSVSVAFANPMTAAWDLIVGGAAGAASRLGIGSTPGQILTVLAGSPNTVGWSRAVDIMSAVGDLIYGGSGGLPTRLAAGTSGNLLQTNGSGAAPTWVPPVTVPGVFGPSGASHSTGLVPDPGAVAGLTRYLREDSSWGTPPGGSGGGSSSGGGGSGAVVPIAVVGPLSAAQATNTN